MPRQVTSAFWRVIHAIREFTVAQRTVALIGVAVLVLGIAALAMWVTKPAYTPLFSGLSGSDANAIVEQLRGNNVPYELSNGGATILVPEANVYDERLKAAAAGLPSTNSGGYSLLDKMGVTSSEFQQSVTYKRALEGELAATIEAMKGVKTASVRLAIPKDSVFVATKSDPTASVFIQTQSGVSLSTDQVQAIVHLTSASIEGMKPTDVAVIDAAGTVLSAVGVGATGSASKQASDYEERVKLAVQHMLDQVVGPGNSTVVVAADMSKESAERVEESYTTPTDSPAINESTKTETYTGSGRTAPGTLGPDNISVPAGNGSDGTLTSESTTRNNAVNKVTESRTIPAGAINRQTVSVAVNEKAAGDLDIAGIRSLVSAAAGIDAARGDAVTVELVSFNTAGAAEAARALADAQRAAEAEQVGAIVRTTVITLGIVLPILAALIIYARRSRRQDRQPVDIGDLTPESGVLEASDLTELVPRELAPNSPPPGSELRRAQLDSFAAKDPQKAAEHLRSLMDDRQNI